MFSAARRCGRRLIGTAAAAVQASVRVAPNGVARIALCRPEARNALGRDLVAQLRQTVASVRFDRSVRVVVLESAVPNVFCAGADLKERATMSPAEVAAFVQSLRATFTEVEALPQPTIAVIDGAAVGGGLELALACDFRVACPSAMLGLVETRLGIIPGAGGTQRLPRLIGATRSKELIFTGRRLDGKRAFEFGVVSHFVDAPSAIDRALELADEILPSVGDSLLRSALVEITVRHQAPIALRVAKQAIDRGLEVDQTTGMAIEELCYAQVINTADRREGIAAFLEKRTPQYKGE